MSAAGSSRSCFDGSNGGTLEVDLSDWTIEELDAAEAVDVARFRTLERVATGSGPSPLAAEAGLLLATSPDGPAARVSVRTADDLEGAPGRSGLVGHYEATDPGAGIAVLEAAARRLGDAGARRVIGPMDGTTWDRYRLALPAPEAGDPPPFLGEPTNPGAYPDHFRAAGFDVVERYESRIVEDLGALAERTREAGRTVEGLGLGVEPLDPDTFDETLGELHALSLGAFAANPFFSPVGFDHFAAMYRPLRDRLDPGLVLVARDARGEAAGFVLAYPDLLDPAGRPTRIVVKSLAVAPEYRSRGLGSLLVHEAHVRAAERGYTAAIHALMHVRNDSLKISRRGGALFRRYALFGRSP